MSRFLPTALNRRLSREERRPVWAGAWRWDKQRWFRYHPKWNKRMGSGFVGRIAFMARYDI